MITQNTVLFHPQATVERANLEIRERVAVDNALEKLRAIGIALGSPHSSKIRGSAKLRELRPRAGRSRTRVFYAQVRESFVIVAIGPEASVDPRGFKHAVALAEVRLGEIAVRHSGPRKVGVARGKRRRGGG
jgi:hypothetical protein